MSFSGRTEVSKTSNEGSIPSIPAYLQNVTHAVKVKPCPQLLTPPFPKI